VRPHLGVVIPAYNEEVRLDKTLSRIREYLDGQDYTWCALVVSDGSTDGTMAIAKQFSESDPRFSAHEYFPNRGKGCAVRTGMLLLDADWLLLSDADLAAPIEEVEKLFDANSPIAIGSRPLKESNLEVRQPKLRELGGRVFNWIVQRLAIKGIKDTQCGFKLFEHDVAKDVFARCEINGYGYDFEALMIANKLGYNIAEIPIRWAHQEGSKVRVLRDGSRTVYDLVKLRLTIGRRLRKPGYSSASSKDSSRTMTS
jgi:dolichyl-phosphate beta-glucosyltransferase